MFLSFESISEEEKFVKLSDVNFDDTNTTFVMFYIDTNENNASFEYRKISSNFDDYSASGITSKRKYTNSKRTANLNNLQSDYYLMAIDPGLFQIHKISVPLFDLPYKIETGDQHPWRFKAQKGKINYVGRLIIGEHRSTSTISYELINSIATDKSEIEKLLGERLKKYPLGSGAGYQDEFYDELTSAEGVKQ